MGIRKFFKNIYNSIVGKKQETPVRVESISGYSGYPEEKPSNGYSGYPVEEEDEEVNVGSIRCIIKTPQFKKGKIWRYKKQTGRFDTKTKMFTPYLTTGHTVQFRTIRQFRGCVVKYL